MFERVHLAAAIVGLHNVVILLRRETNQSFLVQMNRERVERRHQRVQTDIELVAHKEPRILNIQLRSVDTVVGKVHRLKVVHDLNSSALTAVTRLNNPGLSETNMSVKVPSLLLALHVQPQGLTPLQERPFKSAHTHPLLRLLFQRGTNLGLVLLIDHQTGRRIVKRLTILLAHVLQVMCHASFARDEARIDEMIESLIWARLQHVLSVKPSVPPVQIPFLSFFRLCPS